MAAARLKGTTTGLLLDLAAAADIESAESMLRATIAERATFLTGSSLSLECGDLALSTEDVEHLLAICRANGIAVRTISARGEPAYLAPSTPARPQPRQREAASGGEVTSPEMFNSECGLVVGTVRSGHSVQHPGTVIVFGDVNAGAEIVAGESVVVWGALRGTVQAGAKGDPSAVVCALSLAPTQLRIDKHIARAPDGPSPSRGAEMARVQDGSIVVESWAGRRVRPAQRDRDSLPGAVVGGLRKLIKGVR